MNRWLLAGCTTLITCAAAHAAAPLTLEQIMAEPQWIGPAIERPYFSADARSVYYSLKHGAGSIRDLHRIDLGNSRDTIIDVAGMSGADGNEVVYDRAHKRAAFVRNGDIFVRDLGNGQLIQVTRTSQEESAPQFSADDRAVQFRSGSDWYSYDFAGGVTSQVAIIKLEKDPHDKKKDDLQELQLRLFSTLKQSHDDKEAARLHAEEFQRGDSTRAPLPFYLGDDIRIASGDAPDDAQIADGSLSPDGHWLLLVAAPKSSAEAGKIGKLTRYVTESGYEEFENEHTRVGRNDPAPQSLLLLDLRAHEKYTLSYANLPGIHDDPLASVRALNAQHDKDSTKKGGAKKDDKTKAEPKERALQIPAIVWSRDGSNVAVALRSVDNKDRWIASIDFANHALVSQHRLNDAAWINWNFNEMGWEKDNHTLWYESEESGHAQLYARTLGDSQAHALTHGKFEVGQPVLDDDGKFFYLRANQEAPYVYDVYRVAVAGGELQRVSQLKGVEHFALSGDGKQVLITHSASYMPAQISVVTVDGSGDARQLTDTRTPAFKQMQWIQPQIVQVPSSHSKQPIYAKFYKPTDFDPSKKYPAVFFVHGAGYTQNVHLAYPYYFREQMFHNLLTQHGYVVFDMDYRASEGYGRDWRAAIYRQMGHPELEDLLDGKAWLVKNQSVDPNRIGLYGGSYGGFMTLMALFRAPDDFAAGAALRPVTDWTQYNHGYTSDILNTPQVDPAAYQASSPIEFAGNLKHALLIAHGVIDDNVLFEDSARLYQRLIELHKDNFEIAMYPLERHGFVHADSWLDEYKRIYKLFETNLK
jgi:dipeptidyl aminopeptidase/acylaminoacyl peptidase